MGERFEKNTKLLRGKKWSKSRPKRGEKILSELNLPPGSTSQREDHIPSPLFSRVREKGKRLSGDNRRKKNPGNLAGELTYLLRPERRQNATSEGGVRQRLKDERKSTVGKISGL